MFATERLNIIKSYLREHQRLDVHSVSELLNVSEVTIRRDLEKLESEGFLVRIHGGAMPVSEDSAKSLADSSLGLMDDQVDAERLEQEEIARVASQMIQDNDVIALLNGGISPILARRLNAKNGLTVLTNDILVAIEVGGQGSNKAVLLGGSLDSDERSVFGSLTLSNLRNYHVNKLFIEIDGINGQLQLTVKSQEKADLIRESMACTDQTIALCKAANFGISTFFRLGPANALGKIITSPQVADEYKARLFGEGIQIFTSIHTVEGDS